MLEHRGGIVLKILVQPAKLNQTMKRAHSVFAIMQLRSRVRKALKLVWACNSFPPQLPVCRCHLCASCNAHHVSVTHRHFFNLVLIDAIMTEGAVQGAAFLACDAWHGSCCFICWVTIAKARGWDALLCGTCHLRKTTKERKKRYGCGW
jgi:hypothetical protein